jgi:UDP-N-acetylglucosamine transferase subunit ALG13
MIFVTVGHKEFDRLIRKVDDITNEIGKEVVMQIGGRPTYFPKNAKYCRFLTHGEFDDCFRKAELVITHCSVGSLINAMKHSKRLIMVPRYARYGEYGENVYEHQIEFAKAIEAEHVPYVTVVYEAEDLTEVIPRVLNSEHRQCVIQSSAESVIGAIKEFIRTLQK